MLHGDDQETTHVGSAEPKTFQQQDNYIVSFLHLLLHNCFTAAVSSFDTAQQQLATQQASPGRTWKVFFLRVKIWKRFVSWSPCLFYFLPPIQWSAGPAPSCWESPNSAQHPQDFFSTGVKTGKMQPFLTDGCNVLCAGNWQREPCPSAPPQHISESPGRRPSVPKHKLWCEHTTKALHENLPTFKICVPRSDLLIIWPSCFCLWLLEVKTNILYFLKKSANKHQARQHILIISWRCKTLCYVHTVEQTGRDGG